jgi:LPS-assembly protein
VPIHAVLRPCHPRAAWTALALAAALAAAPADAEPPPLQPSTVLAPAPKGEAARQRPVYLQADELTAQPDLQAQARGHVEFRRAGVVLRADRLSYDGPDDRVSAFGNVSIRYGGMAYSGSELQLTVQRFEGYFDQPTFDYPALGAGGRAERVDFLGPAMAQALHAQYTSCPRDGSGDPDWLLRADKLQIDLDTNEGIAEGAVLRFLGVPVLGLPVLSFPLSDARKSGWLPPSIGLDSQSGVEIGVPYYWNIAPNRDATITPLVLSRRGAAVHGQFRYLEPLDVGRIEATVLPNDRVADRSRWATELSQEGSLASGLHYSAALFRVSDNAFWQDFPQSLPAVSPRLLPLDLRADRQWANALGSAQVYAHVQRWQVLQTGTGSELITPPYQRSPQLGLRIGPTLPAGLRFGLETEVNQFNLPTGALPTLQPDGWRWHALAHLSRPWVTPGTWVTPRLSFNAASYRLEPAPALAAVQSTAGLARIIPTASLDAGMSFERDDRWFGKAQRQTLEPRLQYVYTPYRDQNPYPIYDSAQRDYNVVSIFNESTFTGIDRVSDANQLTGGVTTRWVNAETGAESLRLALAQRFLFSEQRVTSDGVPIQKGLSDLLLEGGTSLVPDWRLDASLQFNSASSRIVRSILGAQYSPGPFRTVSAGYRLQRSTGANTSTQGSEQFELGWQWPVYHGSAQPVGASGGCGGTLYAVGRVNYSMKDSRVTDSLIGAEYDAGCWIGRVVAERMSTGRSEAATRVLLQLELVGLSRLGTNPLQTLKDNIPGYQLLRDRRTAPSTTPSYD